MQGVKVLNDDQVVMKEEEAAKEVERSSGCRMNFVTWCDKGRRHTMKVKDSS